MRAARLSLLLLALAGTVIATSASAALPGAPKGLRGFELRPNEAPTHPFSRTPPCEWSPVRGAACYECELATSRSFSGSSLVWSNVSTGDHACQQCRSVDMRVTNDDAASY